MQINWKNRRHLFFMAGIAGAVQYVVLTCLAMYLYPGGTLYAPESTYYRFSENFFSDLGRTTTFLGGSNLLTCSIFTISLLLVGISVVLFFWALPGIFTSNRGQHRLSIGVAGFGILAGICFMGVALTPWDLMLDPHIFFVRTGFLAFLISSLLFTYLIFRHPTYPRRYGYAFVFFVVILSAYVYLLFFGPRATDSMEGLLIQAVGQKIIAYTEVICMSYQAYGALKMDLESVPA